MKPARILSCFMLLTALLAVASAWAGELAYDVEVKWPKGSWQGRYIIDWQACSLKIISKDGTPMRLAKLEVKECVPVKRFSYRGYFDHDPRDPHYWSEADCVFQGDKGDKIACVWRDKNGVSGTTTGSGFWTKFKQSIPSGRGAPGNRVGSSYR